MNSFVKAIKTLDIEKVGSMIAKWLDYEEESGKNALHHLGGVKIADDETKAEKSLRILEMLLTSDMNINSVHRIEDGCDLFPDTPLWYAYAKGRNEKLYRYLLDAGAKPDHCMFAITWNDDVEDAALFQKYGADIHIKNNQGFSPEEMAISGRRRKILALFKSA